MLDVLALATQDTRLHRASINEQAGPCPDINCRCQNDGFRVRFNGEKWVFMCRGCYDAQEMLADKDRRRGWGDAIDYLRHYKHMSFKDAKALVDDGDGGASGTPASPIPVKASGYESDNWQDATGAAVKECIARLWSNDDTRGLDYARGRGLYDETIKQFHIGLDNRSDIPRLIIPSVNDGRYVAIYRRDLRPDVVKDERWKDAPGGTKSELYLADSLRINEDLPIVLVEDAFSALSIWQDCNDIVNVVATGGANCGKLVKWLVKLALAPIVFIALDADEPGDEEAQWWLDRLQNARRLRPLLKDPNDMLLAGQSIRQWITSALEPEAVTQVAEPWTVETARALLPTSPSYDDYLALPMPARIALFTAQPCASCGGYDWMLDTDNSLVCPCIIPKREIAARFQEFERRDKRDKQKLLQLNNQRPAPKSYRKVS